MIQLKCSECGGSIEVRDHKARQRAECPHCSGTVPVPWQASDADPSDSGLICWLGAGLTAVSATAWPDEAGDEPW